MGSVTEGEGGFMRSEPAVAEVGCKNRWETKDVRRGWKRSKSEKTQTPRLRAPVGTPVETGVGRPDGRKPEAGEGAGPGSGV